LKKFLTAFFILFLSFYSLSSSEAATSMRFLKNHTTSDSYLVKEATVVHRTANGLHNERCYKLTCTLSHTHTWHCYIEDCKPSNHICPACGQTHGDSFETFEPKCGCSNISPASQSEINKFIGSSKYTAVDDTITREYTCNNEALLGAGSRVTAVKCTLTYTTYTLIPEQKPLCTHTDDKCSIHSQPFGGNHNDYVPSGTKHVCTNCNKTYYTGVSCSKPDAVACHIDSVCSIHGSTYNGYHGDYTPSYVSYKTCSTCKKTYYTGVSCSLANSPSDPITPEPEQCNLISYGSCSCPLSDIGSPAVTRADTPFSTSFTPSNTYFLIGDSFKINGSHHILRTFDQRVSPMPVSCPGYTPYYICQTHGAACVNSYSGPTAYCGWSGTIIDYGSATYFDKFHDISVVFKGFTVTNNKTSDVITAPAENILIQNNKFTV
jgi:hypothetical protein